MNTQFEDLQSRGGLKTTAVVVLAVLGIFLVAQTVGTILEYKNLDNGQYPSKTMTFQGKGEVFAVPDVATFTFSVTKEGKTVEGAQKDVEGVISKAKDALIKAGIKESDIKTLNYNVSPRYEYVGGTQYVSAKRTFVGYEVTQSTKVKVRNAENSGKVLGEIGALGVTDISSIAFEVDDKDALQKQAREMAIADAKAKAESLSKELGIDLEDIISFYEDNNNYPQPYYAFDGAMGKGMGSAESAVAPTISAGENMIVSNVNITYEID